MKTQNFIDKVQQVESKAQPTPEFIRLPSPESRCPYTGLSRSSLCELVTPCPINQGKPPVKSVLLRKPGAIRGIRLISYKSLMEYLHSCSNE